MNKDEFEKIINESIDRIVILYNKTGSWLVGEFNKLNLTNEGYEISVNTKKGLVSQYVKPEDLKEIRVL